MSRRTVHMSEEQEAVLHRFIVPEIRRQFAVLMPLRTPPRLAIPLTITATSPQLRNQQTCFLCPAPSGRMATIITEPLSEEDGEHVLHMFSRGTKRVRARNDATNPLNSRIAISACATHAAALRELHELINKAGKLCAQDIRNIKKRSRPKKHTPVIEPPLRELIVVPGSQVTYLSIVSIPIAAPSQPPCCVCSKRFSRLQWGLVVSIPTQATAAAFSRLFFDDVLRITTEAGPQTLVVGACAKHHDVLKIIKKYGKGTLTATVVDALCTTKKRRRHHP